MSLHLVPFGLALGANPCASLGHVFTQKDPFFPRQFRKSSLIVEPPISRAFMQTPPRRSGGETFGRICNIFKSGKIKESEGKIFNKAVIQRIWTNCLLSFKRNVTKFEYSNFAPLEILEYPQVSSSIFVDDVDNIWIIFRVEV